MRAAEQNRQYLAVLFIDNTKRQKRKSFETQLKSNLVSAYNSRYSLHGQATQKKQKR
ncbi:hypothetical protein FORC54_4147 [Vibrio vulnificus]|nr:hypothetical protein FORC54_4147 [Vibrio vulnificus]